MRRLLLVVLSLSRLASAEAAHAQAPLEPFGLRVRVAHPPPALGIIEGRLLDLTPTSLTLGRPAGTVVLHGVTTLGTYRGTVPHVGRGAGWGAVVGGSAGLLAGVLLAVATRDCYDAPFCDIAPAAAVGVLTALGAAGGATLGSLVGLLARTPRWDPVSTDQFYDRGVRIRVRPATPDAAILEGFLAAPPSSEGLAITADGRTTLVPLATLQNLAVYRGRGTRNVLGLLLGAGAGAIGGTLLGATSENLEFIPLGVLAGATAGFLVGSAIPKDHWEPVPVPRIPE